MGRLWETLKPAARARTHLLAAAVLWTVVGAVLLALGTAWAWRGPAWARFTLPVALGAGMLKSWLVLDRAAERIAGRIEARGDGRCLGGFLSPGTWVLVVGMMVAGRILRGGLIPRYWVGLVYAAVGVGLLGSSRLAWGRLAGRRGG